MPRPLGSARSLRTAGAPLGRFSDGSASLPLMAAAACLGTAALTVLSVKTVLAFLIVLLVMAFWALRPEFGLAALWLTWLLIPGVRRVLDTVLVTGEYDPLSIVPFAATAAVAGLELLGRPLPSRPERIMLLALSGLAIGIAAGVAHPTALTFALLAYGAGILAFAIGYREGKRADGADTAGRALVALLAPLAVYAIAQYVLPLSVWDEQWVRESNLTSIVAPGDPEHVRVFSTLNSPATFGGVLAVGLVVALARDRLSPGVAAAIACALVALALTYVRMALPALAVGLLVYAAASRWRAAPRLAALALIVVLATLALGATTRVGGLVIERVTTLGSLSEDHSANERQQTFGEALPEALFTPLGHGIGSAGEPSKLAQPEQAFTAAVDNGYLGLLYQVGPVGFVLVLMAVGGAAAGLVLARPRTDALRKRRQLTLAVVTTLLVLAAATDVFYGILGVLLWFYLGQSMAVAELAHADARATAGAHR
jgi:O-Antigen ligase